MSGHDAPISTGFRKVFIDRVPAMLALGLIVLGGSFAMNNLVREGSPDLEIPIALIQTTWPGASPEMVEKEVTAAIERKIKAVDGLKVFKSASMNSFSLIQVEFSATAPLQESLRDLRTKVSEAESELPSNAEPPAVDAISVTDRPVVAFVLTADLDDAIMGQLAQRVKRRLERVQGVKEADISGHREEQIQILLRPERMAEAHLSPAVVARAVSGANFNRPLGRIANPAFTSDVDLSGRFEDPAAIGELTVLHTPDGRNLTIDDIAYVRRDLEPTKTRSSLSLDGGEFRKSVVIGVKKVPGSDTVESVEKAAAALAEMAAGPDWPAGVEITRIDDETELIAEVLGDGISNTLQACLAVFCVLFMLLSWREALVAGIAVPVTFLATLLVLYFMGQTLNAIVIIGMILALGLLVDVFILVMEGMHEGIYTEGLSFPRAVRATVRTYALPAFAGQMTTILALVPLFVIGGTAGKFIRLIPTTMVVCLICSFVVAFFLTLPLSRAVFRGTHDPDKVSFIDRLTRRLSAKLAAWVEAYVLRSKRIAGLWVLALLVVFGVSLKAATYLKFEMFPKSDDPKVGITVELDPNATLDDSQRIADEIKAALRERSDIKSAAAYVGRISPLGGGFGQRTVGDNLLGFTLTLVDSDQREKLTFEIVDTELRPTVEAITARHPGATAEFSVRTGGTGSGAPIQIAVSGPDMPTLGLISGELQGILGGTAGVTQAGDDVGTPGTTIQVTPRSEVLDFYGITADDMAQQARYLMGEGMISTFDMPGTEDPLEIHLGTRWPSRGGELGGPRSWSEMQKVAVVTPRGERVPLGVLNTMRITSAPVAITRQDGERTIVVSAEAAGRTVGEVLADAVPRIEQAAKAWPPGYGFRIGGEAESTAETFGNVPMAFVLAMFLVFSVLALLFGSFSQPLIILATVPMALSGTLIGFFFTGLPLSFPATIGIIALIGIVVNDSIVMVETMNTYRAGDMNRREAAARGAADRLRPIFSTTLTTTVGMIPLALSDITWMPLAMAVVFGLMASTVFAFVVIPALYLLVTPAAAPADVAHPTGVPAPSH